MDIFRVTDIPFLIQEHPQKSTVSPEKLLDLYLQYFDQHSKYSPNFLKVKDLSRDNTLDTFWDPNLSFWIQEHLPK